ncbi:MAG: DUF4974 domain-containing protein [Bacteroidetes bacterium]|nr:DUF4974 domain-containing protein [Bacteroidota bacterium]
MTDYNEHIEALMARHFTGESSALEAKELQEWRRLDTENEKYFQDMEFVFYAGASIRKTRTFDVDAAWRKIAPVSVNRQSGKIQIGFRRSLAIAASIVLVALLGYFLVFKGAETPMEYHTEKRSLEVKLPDNSTVNLKPGTHLVALSSDPLSREYQFDGVADFEVEHQTEHPFVLHSLDLRITDLGTVFHVEALPENDTVRVQVFEGRVGMSSSEEGIELVANESAYYIRSSKEFVVMRPVPPIETGSFDFESKTLGQVIAELNDHFTKQVVLANPKLNSCRIDVQFRDETLEAMLEILELTLQLETMETDQQIIIQGNACH